MCKDLETNKLLLSEASVKKINSLFVEWRSVTFYKEIYQQLQKVSTEINYQRKRQNRRLKRNLAKRYDN